MKLILLLLIIIICACTLYGGYKAGIELDALPYISGGYYTSLWLGSGNLRIRGVVAHINVPEFAIKDGFKDNSVAASAIIVDYYFALGFEGWWLGTGFEYWDSEISVKGSSQKFPFESYIYTLGGGYAWKINKYLYINPWVAVHLLNGGDKEVNCEHTTYKPNILTPEFSVKLGFMF